MKVDLSKRKRALLTAALEVYEKLAKSVKANLGSLNLPEMDVDRARVNVEAIKQRLDGSATEIDLPHDFRITCRNALVLMQAKLGKVEGAQEELQVDTSATQETEYEVQALIRELAEQMALPVEG